MYNIVYSVQWRVYSVLHYVYSSAARSVLYRQSRQRPVLTDSLVSFTVRREGQAAEPRTTHSLLRIKAF